MSNKLVLGSRTPTPLNPYHFFWALPEFPDRLGLFTTHSAAPNEGGQINQEEF